MIPFIPAHSSNYATENRGRDQIRYLVIHYTGNCGDTAKGNCLYFQGANRHASAHYFVDENGVWQSVEDKNRAWHCGSETGKYFHPSCRNANSIGIEVCMLDKSGQVRQDSIRQAEQLARTLMQKYGIPPAQVVRHYDVTHKICPAPMVNDPALWNAFREALSHKEDDSMTQEQFDQKLENWLSRYDPLYQRIEDIPEYLREEARSLIKQNALRGEEGQLNIRRGQLRTMIVAKRYVDALLCGKNEA